MLAGATGGCPPERAGACGWRFGSHFLVFARNAASTRAVFHGKTCVFDSGDLLMLLLLILLITPANSVATTATTSIATTTDSKAHLSPKVSTDSDTRKIPGYPCLHPLDRHCHDCSRG